ncbi:ATP-binding cassette sub-family B member 10, mitochondrial [Patella vulgata]|uniref:ATP-binding cassette sub-family B member 10, mitochondrial n=1 Tax=Patella vulgata TaxID=6465 RepID=UPI00217FB787|nr:ATP-binding cassette sub-family B member 10, mitochondrial [Patella vulgata]XP_050404464.1 ATP-binding cassette sub-family B member 10, mitochondrial [Patella vulgata]
MYAIICKQPLANILGRNVNIFSQGKSTIFKMGFLNRTCKYHSNIGSNLRIQVIPCTRFSFSSRKYSMIRDCFKKDLKKSQRVYKSTQTVNINLQQATLNAKSQPRDKKDILKLIGLAKPEKWKIVGAVCLLLISSSVSMAVPFCLGKVIDIIYTASQDGTLVEKLNNICKILVGIFLIGALANFGRVYLMQISGQNIVKRMRERLFNSILQQEIGFFDKNKTGELINRLSTDTSIVGTSVTMNISAGLRSSAQAIGGLGMMFYVSPKLAAISLAIVPPVAICSIIYGRYIKNITKKVQDSLANATQVAEERISNVRTVRAFAQESKECQSYSEKISKVLQLQYKEALAQGVFWGFSGLSGNMIILSVFYNGGLMMTESQITVGDLTAFLLYAAYVGISIAGLSSFYTELMRGLGASSRIWQLVEKQPTIPLTGGIIPSTPVQGNIEFRNIGFHYPTRSDVSIFTDLNLSVPSGNITAVVGASGSGKSTLGHLLLRFYDPQSGNVYLDNEDINSLNPTWLRNHIGTVSQEPILFSSSIADNIAYGAGDISTVKTEDIWDAARKANAYKFIVNFPEGFDTMVGERGLMLSGGQRQRIAIARAILKNPKILLLDEATSALDSESEYLVQEALERLMIGRTVITIAHRLSTIKSANQIAVIDSGKIAEVGSYSDLMRIQDGIFKKLVERQTITY